MICFVLSAPMWAKDLVLFISYTRCVRKVIGHVQETQFRCSK